MNIRHGGDIYKYERDLIDFSSNINPLGPPQALEKVFNSDWQQITRYPDREYRRLREMLAEKHDIEPEGVVVGNGAIELIYLVGRLLADSSAVIPEPTFSEYAHVLDINEGRIERVLRDPGKGFRLPLKSLRRKLNRTAAVFLCRPNNPAGELIPRQKLDRELPRDRLIISDESFLDFLPEDEEETLTEWLPEHDRLVVLRSATKFYALPGLRLGYALTTPELAARMRRHQITWSVNALACAAGRIIYGQKSQGDFQKRSQRWLAREQEYLRSRLEQITHFELFPGRANFLLLKIRHEQFTAKKLNERMRQRGLLIREADSFSGLDESYFRVAVKSRQANDKLIAALTSAVGESENGGEYS
ncbi:threonine-phosphate decarboxylase CobD [Halarsenatibacter silvermanii]|uniref:threonine-phosphate decarboxylase n=1 Tax=Halarsenatibacter silvermanii TaxID=321763 RepID=A0A1G9MUQ1_9FIRM|nr:threonine-phosphate decarboxylase CobD [Halarsenatibacter silvermanii]SDL77980.1 L-threonine O-3-phosphate decarboxylase [Halarsenatibacter silvermanii]